MRDDRVAARRHRVALGDFTCLVWQRNYYEHVIRDDNDLTRIENYIAGNPRHCFIR